MKLHQESENSYYVTKKIKPVGSRANQKNLKQDVASNFFNLNELITFTLEKKFKIKKPC